LLGHIADALKEATPIDQKAFAAHPATYIAILPNGALYFQIKVSELWAGID
jgi:hypothetical protein